MNAGDPVDRVIEMWRRERPDLDPSAKAVTARVVRLADDLHQIFDAVFARHGLKRTAYSTLLALRRSGSPFELTPSQISDELFVTSGGLTPVLDRLEALNHIERRPHPTDRRGTIVRLTASGRDLVDGAMTAHAEAEHRAVADLTNKEREVLATLLRKLASSVAAARL